MALTIDPAIKRVTIPQADLTLISGSLYEFDTNQFRLALGALMADEEFIYLPFPFLHNTEVTVLGVIFARTIQMINGWSLTFENVAMSVQYSGSNNDLFDSENGILINQALVNVIGNNSAGLQTVVSGSGVTEQDKLDISDRVWDETLSEHTSAGSTGEALDNVSAGASPSTIADAVWNHVKALTFNLWYGNK